MASELSISETDGQSTDGEEMKIGIETPPILHCPKKNGKDAPKSVRASMTKKIPRLDNSSALDQHDQKQKKEEPKE